MSGLGPFDQGGNPNAPSFGSTGQTANRKQVKDDPNNPSWEWWQQYRDDWNQHDQDVQRKIEGGRGVSGSWDAFPAAAQAKGTAWDQFPAITEESTSGPPPPGTPFTGPAWQDTGEVMHWRGLPEESPYNPKPEGPTEAFWNDQLSAGKMPSDPMSLRDSMSPGNTPAEYHPKIGDPGYPPISGTRDKGTLQMEPGTFDPNIRDPNGSIRNQQKNADPSLGYKETIGWADFPQVS